MKPPKPPKPSEIDAQQASDLRKARKGFGSGGAPEIRPEGEFATTKTFRLSRRLSVEITAGSAGFSIEWAPGMPNKLTAKELRRYRAARAEMVKRLAERMGGAAVVVVEL